MTTLRLPPAEGLPASLAELRRTGPLTPAGHPARAESPKEQAADSHSTGPLPPPGRRTRAGTPEEQAYDRFFGVRRYDGDPAALLYRALRQALGAPELASPGLRALSRMLEPVLPVPWPQPSPVAAGALEHWIAGHRLFFVLTQLTTVALRDARAAADHHAPALTAALLLRTGAEALRLTASFPAERYRDSVRPAMSPPGVPKGFSGLWSADHRVLVRELHTWGAHHLRVCDGSCPAQGRLVAALGEVHAAHHGVCARFVGARPSLLGGAADSLATLERLSRTRRRALSPEPEPEPQPEP